MSKIETSQEEYWKANFNNEKIIRVSDDLQMNIARTKMGKRVDKEIWNKTLSYLLEILEIKKDSKVLELCCGNGVIIGEIAKHCDTALGIDYSKELLRQLKKKYPEKNLNVEENDVNKFAPSVNSFDVIIIYFSIQHFNERNTFMLIEKCIKALKPNGKILVGDIPDLDKKWDYICKPEYQLDYFKRVVECSPKIGYWFQKDFFRAMNSCFDNTSFKIIEQPVYQINSDHCFDLLIEKSDVE